MNTAKSKGELTRRRILEVATELIADDGIQNVTCSKIATVAGLTQPAIYKYFRNLEEVLLAALQLWIAEAQTEIDRGGDEFSSAEEQLKSMVRENFKYSAANRKKDILLLSLLQFAVSSPNALALYQTIIDGGIHRIHTLVERGHREKCWTAREPRAVAQMIHSLLVAEILKLTLRPEEVRLETRVKRTWKATRNLLGLDLEFRAPQRTAHGIYALKNS